MTAPSASSAPERETRFRAVYEACYADVLRFVRRRAHASHAEDVVAEVFLVAWRRFDELPALEDAARAWLFGVARNLMLNSKRGQDRRDALAVRIATDRAHGPSHEDETDLVERRIDLAAAWPRLSAVDQEALALAVWDGLSATEAAAVLQISAVAFRLRLSRARRALRRHLSHPAEPARTRNRPASTTTETSTP